MFRVGARKKTGKPKSGISKKRKKKLSRRVSAKPIKKRRGKLKRQRKKAAKVKKFKKVRRAKRKQYIRR